MLQWRLDDSLRTLADDNVEFARMLERGEIDVGLYRPSATDKTNAGRKGRALRRRCRPWSIRLRSRSHLIPRGRRYFVAAAKQFESFAPDFCARVIFFGKRL